MFKLFRSILSSNRNRRRFAVGLALRLLRLIRDIEKDETFRFSDELDEFDSDFQNDSRREYNAIEDDYIECEHALGFLESAIEDLEYAY